MTARTVRGMARVAAAAALITSVAACSAPSGGAAAGSGGADPVVVGMANEPETLSPLLGYGKDGNSKIFDGLLTHDADMKLRPALAEALPDVSPDGLTYTYRLRRGVKFSDGAPFGAKDVLFTYRTILDPKTNNASKSELDAIASVEAPGDDTVVFTLKYPYAPFAERTVLPVAPEHIAGKQDVNSGGFTTAPVGTGPYVLTAWSKGEKLAFKANPSYWGGEPAVKKFTMAVVKDDDVRATRLRSGELDGAILPPNLAKGASADGARKTHTAKTFDYRNVTMPTGNAVTGDTAVRRALDIAVDRGAMVDKLLDGAGKAAYGPVPTDSPWFTPGTERAHDLARARKILDGAGWVPGPDGVRAKDGVRAAFPLWYTSGDKIRQEHALAFASDAKKAGIQVTTESGSWEVIEPRMKTDAVLAGGGSPADPDFDQYLTLSSSLAGDGFNNMARYDNPVVDRALLDGRRSGDPAARKAAYDTVQRELALNPGYVYLTHIDHVYVMADRWDGPSTQIEPHDHGLGSGPWWNIESWKPKQK
ncbi:MULTISPECIES: ABC transporter substrate-binding protein [unclassified Streptomyces]|uniref:ABC transporter substrate-binding protein n=1 Tax=unclassified Streptomyces TaxID=2593676 RepID=UPI000DC79EAE|nr:MULTISPECIES: ABC transporter substrate-binding protein [unclassified Streptomyces]AWZ07165.1 ABC transporter substrate-binding protein [Streptomyces sp. ICC4]AWZ13856.1 ABC transporter substrate-binding protein [Streptomyces sp. ICC1]